MDAGPMTPELVLDLLDAFDRDGACVEFRGPSYVDIHPLAFAPDGSARQSGLDATSVAYPAAAFTAGTLAGRSVGCLSAAHQRLFHSGYELRDVDRQDLAALDGAGR